MSAYKRSDPTKLAKDRAAIQKSQEDLTQPKEQDQVRVFGSPSERGVPAPRQRGRRMLNLGIVTKFKQQNGPV